MAGEKILIVDDKAEIVQFCNEYLLRPKGYVPIVATDGREGLDIALQEKPALIILDFNLPGMSGLEILQTLRHKQINIPVIFITAYSSEEDIVTAFRLGIIDYFSKPFNPREMLETIERTLGENKLQEQQTRQQRELEKCTKELGYLYGSSVERLLNRTVEAAVGITDAEEGYLLLVDDQTDELYIRSALNLGESFARNFRLRVGDGIAGRVVRDGQSVRYNNIDDTNRFKLKTGYLVKSLINVPLRHGGEIIGVLGVSNRLSARNFTRTDQQLLASLAEHAATAIANASLYAETHQTLARRLRELAVMQEVAHDLNAIVDLGRIAATVLNHAVRTTYAEAGLVGLRAEDRVDWVPYGYAANAMEDKTWTPSWEDGLIGQAARSGQAMLMNDLSDGFEAMHALKQTRSRLIVPVLRGNQAIGIIDLQSSNPNAFSEDDKRFLLQLADRAAVAVENTRLFERVVNEQHQTKTVLQSIADGVYTVDCDLQIVTFNPAAEHITGWREAEVQGRLCSEVLVDAHRSAQGRQTLLIQQALETGQPCTSGPDEPPILSRDGREVFVSSSVAPIHSREGSVIGAVVAFRDVSAERELDRLKSDFVSMVSHELRSPLASLSAAIDLLRSTPNGETTTAQMLDIAHENTQRLIHLVEDILNISQIDAGQVRVQQEPVTLMPILRRVIHVAQNLTTIHHISLRTSNHVPFVMADPSKLEIVLHNLLDNAIRYSPDGGRILVKVTGPTDDEMVISVIDEGIGIPQEQMDQVFGRFYRVDNSDGCKVYGHGLGLYISKHLVEMQGGRIWVQSKERQGSCFSFSLPIVKEVELAKEVGIEGV